MAVGGAVGMRVHVSVVMIMIMVMVMHRVGVNVCMAFLGSSAEEIAYLVRREVRYYFLARLELVSDTRN